MGKDIFILKNIFGKGKYWSKRLHINFSFLEKKKPAFFFRYYMSSLLQKQLSVFFTKSGKLSKSLNLVLRGFILSFNSFRRNKTLVLANFLLNKNYLEKFGKLILKYRVSGKMKKSRLGRRRYKQYYTFLSFYRQWRRSIRFISFFIKKKGTFTEKFKTEINKLRSKNFHYKRDSILFRSSRMWSGLAIKHKDARNQDEGRFKLKGTPFMRKFFKTFFIKYKKSFKRDRNFIKKSHPNIRRY